MKIIISNYSGEPIYEQIKQQMKESIYSEELKEGDMLPSIRQLAKDLKISVITTTRAYEELEREGLVCSVQGKGFYVLPQNMEMVKENARRKIEAAFIESFSAARSAGIDNDELRKIFEVLLADF